MFRKSDKVQSIVNESQLDDVISVICLFRIHSELSSGHQSDTVQDYEQFTELRTDDTVAQLQSKPKKDKKRSQKRRQR
jgi:acetyl-CoA carboxylase beta subunit